MPAPIEGIIVASLTPFGPGGEGVNEEALGRHLDFLAAAGIPAIAPAGTTGEFLYLTEEEKSAVIRAAVRAAAGRLRVIAGIWALRPDGVARLAREAEAAGADAVFLTTPIYYPASESMVVAWYRHARAHTRLPLFAYHIPQYAGNGVSTAALRRLVDDGVVQGIKDSTGDASRLRELLDACGGRIPVYGASDGFALRARELGADGFISALANVYPETFMRIWSGDAAAQAVVDRLRAAVKAYGGVGALKALLRARGFDFGPARLPFGYLAPEEERRLVDEAGRAG